MVLLIIVTTKGIYNIKVFPVVLLSFSRINMFFPNCKDGLIV